MSVWLFFSVWFSEISIDLTMLFSFPDNYALNFQLKFIIDFEKSESETILRQITRSPLVFSRRFFDVRQNRSILFEKIDCKA